MNHAEALASELEIDIVQGCLDGWLDASVFEHIGPELRHLCSHPDEVWVAIRFGRVSVEEAKPVLFHVLRQSLNPMEIMDCIKEGYLTPQEARPIAFSVLQKSPRYAAAFHSSGIITKEEFLEVFHQIAKENIDLAIWLYSHRKAVSLDTLKPYLLEVAKGDKFRGPEFVQRELLTEDELSTLLPS